MAEPQTKTMMTPSGEVVRFQIDPSLPGASDVEAVQKNIVDQWKAQRGQQLPPIQPTASKESPSPAVSQAAKPGASALHDTYPALGDKISKAKQAGYSDAEIQKHIQGKIHAAFKAGYSQDEVKNYLGKGGPTTGQKAAEVIGGGLEAAPGALWGMAKGIGRAAITPPKEGLWTFKPQHFVDVAKGAARGLTAGIYQPEAKDEAQRARQTLGELGGFAVPFTAGSKGLQAVGLPGWASRIGTVGAMSAAEPASRGQTEEAAKSFVTGGAMAAPFEILPALRKKPPAEQAALEANIPTPEQAAAAVGGTTTTATPAVAATPQTFTQTVEGARKPKAVAQPAAAAPTTDPTQAATAQPAAAAPQTFTQVAQATGKAPKPKSDPMMIRLKEILIKEANGQPLTPEEEGFKSAMQQAKPTTQARPAEPANLQQILKQQDIETAQAGLIKDLRDTIANPNLSAMAKENARAELQRLGVPEAEPTPGAKPTFTETVKGARKPKGKAVKAVPTEAPPATPAEAQPLTGDTLENQIHNRALEILRQQPPGKVMTMDEAAAQARAELGPRAAAKPPLPPLSQEEIAAAEELTGRKYTPKAPPKPRPSKVVPRQEKTLQGAIKAEGGLASEEFSGEISGYKQLGKIQPGTFRKGGRNWNKMAEVLHADGFLPEPTTDALQAALRDDISGRRVKSSAADYESDVKQTEKQIQNLELESGASAYIDQLAGTKETLRYKGKEYQGAEAEKGGNLRLKDDPDTVLTKAKDILDVERTEPPESGGFPWEQEEQAKGPASVMIDGKVTTGGIHAEAAEKAAGNIENYLKLKAEGRAKSGFGDSPENFVEQKEPGTADKPPETHFEKTEAGMQGVMPGMEGRTVPEKGLGPKAAQKEVGTTPLEEAAKPSGGTQTKLYGGLPVPAMVDVAKKFIVEPLGDLRTAMRTIYSPRSVSEEAGLAQRLLTRRTSRIEETVRYITQKFRGAKVLMEPSVKDGTYLDFWHNLETGQKQGTPLHQKISDMLRSALDVNTGELTKRNLLKRVIDDYAPHQFDRPEVAQQVMAAIEARQGKGRSLQGPSYFLKQRTLAGTVKEILESPEAQQAGLKLRYPNSVEAVEKLLFDSARLIHGHDLLKEELMPRGMVKLYKDPRQVPPNWTEVEGYRPPRRPVAEANRPDAPAVYVPIGKYYAPDNVARILNNYTRPGLYTSNRVWATPLQWLREASAVANTVNLGLSSFHALTTATNSFAGEVGRGIMALKEGKPLQAAKNFGMAGTYFGPIIRDVRYGRQLEKFADVDPAMRAQYPQTAQMVQQFIDSGGRIDASRPFFSRYIDAGLKALEDRSIVEGGNGTIAKGLRNVLTLGTDFIMTKIVAPAKIAAFANRFQDFVERHPGLTDDQMLAGSNKILDTIDDAFGLVNYDRWGLDRHIRDSLFVALRAPGWTLGNLKILGGGLEDLARGKITERSARLMGDVAGVALTGTLINLALTGKPPDVDPSKPLQSIYNLMNPESGGINPDGTPSRMGFAGIQRDWGHLLFNVVKPMWQGDPQSAVRGLTHFGLVKESPVIGMATKLATGKDYYDRDIVDPTKGLLGQTGDFAKGLGRELLPFSLSNIMAEHQRGVQRPWWQGGWIGATPPMAASATETKFMRLLNEKTMMHRNMDAAQEEHVSFKKDLYEKMAKGENISNLLSSGSVTRSDVKEAQKRLMLQRQPQGQLRYALSRPGVALTTLAELAPTATTEEAPLILKSLEQKFVNAVNRGAITPKSKKMFDEARKSLREKVQGAKVQRDIVSEGFGSQPNL